MPPPKALLAGDLRQRLAAASAPMDRSCALRTTHPLGRPARQHHGAFLSIRNFTSAAAPRLARPELSQARTSRSTASCARPHGAMATKLPARCHGARHDRIAYACLRTCRAAAAGETNLWVDPSITPFLNKDVAISPLRATPKKHRPALADLADGTDWPRGSQLALRGMRLQESPTQCRDGLCRSCRFWRCAGIAGGLGPPFEPTGPVASACVLAVA